MGRVKWDYPTSQLEDIKLLLNQRSEAEYVGRKNAVDNVRNDRNARIESSDAIVLVEYMSWFRLARKPYLLFVEARSRQLRRKRERRPS
ncbi:hypothetical protein Goari_023786 [Gossypium aridum]|uniref:Uncharacterized protein n=1 Tax=Gossypium aridum TaxID=34290 RepID=A0A7J8X431_GOSAI|nr:hypothetical protein [Gossypium aridum]